jgi:predicted SnoaL-like aldol condensation-catalyzing enzyme
MSRDAILADVEKIWKEHLTDQPPQTPEQIKAAKALIELFLAAFVYHDYARARELVSEDYIQHNPSLGTGRESIIEFAERETTDPNRPFTFNWKRIFVDGQYVIAHNHVDIRDGTDGVRVVEILRYENGVFTEHWDTVSPVPPKSEWKNANGPF